MRKPFDQTLFDENDGLGIRVAGKTLVNDGWMLYAEQPSDPYGPDLAGYIRDEASCFIEAEVKHAWREGMKFFPFSTVNIPYRKKELLKMPNLFFTTVSKDGLGVLAIRGDMILTHPTEIVKNKYVAEGERFFKVPLREFIYLPAKPTYKLRCCKEPLRIGKTGAGLLVCRNCKEVL